MNTTPQHVTKRRSAFILASLLVLFLAMGLAAWGITGFFRLGQDARSLRNSLRTALEIKSAWNEKLELSVGGITCGLVRTGLSFAPLEPEARLAVNAVRGGEVGIYKLNSSRAPMDCSDLLGAADKAMEARGWERLVGVISQRELVAVYVPSDAGNTSRLRACVAVLNRDQLVIASGAADVNALTKLAVSQLEKHRPEWQNVRL